VALLLGVALLHRSNHQKAKACNKKTGGAELVRAMGSREINKDRISVGGEGIRPCEYPQRADNCPLDTLALTNQ